MRLLVIGGSDAGISAGLRARELDPSVEVSLLVADAYPNFSICGLPYYAVRQSLGRHPDGAQTWTRHTQGGQPAQTASHETSP